MKPPNKSLELTPQIAAVSNGVDLPGFAPRWWIGGATQLYVSLQKLALAGFFSQSGGRRPESGPSCVIQITGPLLKVDV